MESWHSQLMPYDFILEIARDTGFLRRLRKLNPAYLLFVLVFGVSCHTKPTFEEIFRRYINFDDNPKYEKRISIQSFKKRFDQNMVDFLSCLLSYYMRVMISESPARLKGSVDEFKDILLQDSSWKGSGDRVPFHLVKSGSAHRVPQMVIYGSGDRALFPQFCNQIGEFYGHSFSRPCKKLSMIVHQYQ